MVDVNVEVHMGDLLKKLKTLPEKVQNKVLKGAVRASAKPIVKEAKRLVPVRTGNLKKSIGVTMARTKGSTIRIYVSPRKGGKYDGWYGHLVELGTRHSAPHPFLRPAYEAKASETIDAFHDYLQKRLEKELAK